MAERLRLRIREHTFAASTQPLNITVSIGVVCLDSARPLTTDVFIQTLDKQLYKAKKNGRNCVCGLLYSETSSESP